jgi:pyruvate formate lyase activating enzyme
MFHKAEYYRMNAKGIAECLLCPRHCRIAPEKAGFCQVRMNQNGRLIAVNFAKAASIALDPVEKKPLYHFYPGRMVLSVGTIGCNLACDFCQNWHISRAAAPTTPVTPVKLAALAIESARAQGGIGLAYTYSEPLVWFEFLKEVMPRIRRAGLKNVLVTNGFLEPKPWDEILQWTDAANIDLKAFTPEYYQRLCHGHLEPVLANIRAAHGRIHLELTTLLVPGENDAPQQVAALAQWVATLDPEIPLHLSRYYPAYKMKEPPTPLESMERARHIAAEYLHFVYLGNISGANDTFCPDCGSLLIERDGYQARSKLTRPACPDCGRKIPLIMEE